MQLGLLDFIAPYDRNSYSMRDSLCPYAEMRDETGPSHAPAPGHQGCPGCFDYSMLLDEHEILKGYLQHAKHQVDRLRRELMDVDPVMSVAHSDIIHHGFKQAFTILFQGQGNLSFHILA